MKDIKLELFNFKKKLNLDQQDISIVAESHMEKCGEWSDKKIISSLNEKLKKYKYDSDVKALLEDLNSDERSNQLLYDLKDLYEIINAKNQGELYRQPLNVLLDIINMDNDADRTYMIMNNLAIYKNWIPEIKILVSKLLETPEQKSDFASAGTAENVYTIVEKVEDGFLVYIKDSWFLLKDDDISKALLENYIKDDNELKLLRDLQSMMNIATITEDMISFTISPELTIGFGVGNTNKGIYINGDNFSENGETTLSSIFSSTVIPLVNKGFYILLDEIQKNLDKFVDLDVVKKITNILKPNITYYCFNYKNIVYAYVCDENPNGGGLVTDFYQYENAQDLVDEVNMELSYDLTYFYQNKLKEEKVVRKQLEDKEREITVELESLNMNIDRLNASIKLLGESKELKDTLKNITKRRDTLNNDLGAIKELKKKNYSRVK